MMKRHWDHVYLWLNKSFNIFQHFSLPDKVFILSIIVIFWSKYYSWDNLYVVNIFYYQYYDIKKHFSQPNKVLYHTIFYSNYFGQNISISENKSNTIAVIPKICSADHWWSGRLAEVVPESINNSIFCPSRNTKFF